MWPYLEAERQARQRRLACLTILICFAAPFAGCRRRYLGNGVGHLERRQLEQQRAEQRALVPAVGRRAPADAGYQRSLRGEELAFGGSAVAPGGKHPGDVSPGERDPRVQRAVSCRGGFAAEACGLVERRRRVPVMTKTLRDPRLAQFQ